MKKNRLTKIVRSSKVYEFISQRTIKILKLNLQKNPETIEQVKQLLWIRWQLTDYRLPSNSVEDIHVTKK